MHHTPFSLCMGRTVTENVHPIADDHHPRTVLRMRCGPPKTIINQWKRDHIKNAVYAGLSSRSAIFWIHQTSREENLSTRSICICICGVVGSDFFFVVVVVVVRCILYSFSSEGECFSLLLLYSYLYNDKNANTVFKFKQKPNYFKFCILYANLFNIT